MTLPIRKAKKNGVAYGYSSTQEKSLAKSLGGKTTKASGSQDQKGDVIVPNLARIECKSTTKKSFSVTQDMLQKIKDASLCSNEVPFIQIDFLDEQGNVVSSCCVMPSEFINDVIERCS